jgi:hypothetical protein
MSRLLEEIYEEKELEGKLFYLFSPVWDGKIVIEITEDEDLPPVVCMATGKVMRRRLPITRLWQTLYQLLIQKQVIWVNVQKIGPV